MQKDWINGNVEISVSGIPVQLGFTVPAKPVKLSRMLPVFQKMSDAFNDLGQKSLEAEGKRISCKAGCGACCRQLVPISEAEAHDLRSVLENLPEPRQQEIRRRFDDAIQKLNGISFFERLEKSAKGTERDYADAVSNYFSQQIACPFLEDESCSIHESRPIACREYLVTSPAEHCSSATGEKIENVEYSFKIKDALISIGRNNLKAELPFVPLIRLLEWTENQKDDSPEHEGKDWMQLFFTQLVEVGRQPAP